MTKNILIVEDEERMREFIGVYLRAEGYKIYEAEDAYSAFDILENKKIHLVILDIMIPKINGFEVCKKIRKTSQVPIIIVSAVIEEKNQLLAYQLGVDDYITKPFNIKILLAKVKRQMYRTSNDEDETSIEYKDIRIDLDSQQVFIDSKEINFTCKEFGILTYLVRNKNKVLSRKKILMKVWQYDYFDKGRIIDNHIKNIRKKLQPYSHTIKTIPNIGYKFEEI